MDTGNDNQRPNAVFMERIMVTRASLYPPEEEAWAHGGTLLVPAGYTSLGVDVHVVERNRVTISGRGPDAQDGFGFEVDMTPDDACRLAALLEPAADRAGAEQ